MKRGISRTAEFERIRDLPRRKWEDLDLQQLTKHLNAEIKTPEGIMTLRHIQTAALSEFHDYEGLFGSIGVGHGKSLICYLAPTLVNAQRPLLLVPAKLKEKTERELKEYGKHFKVTNNFKIMSYELLSRPRGIREFAELNPDLIIADECHKLKNTKAACTRLVKRYLKSFPETKMIAVSGTITRKSLMDYQHILDWCLKETMPLPKGWREVTDWSLALDQSIRWDFERLQPGVLSQFNTEQEKQDILKEPKKTLEITREGYRRRLTETAGVIATSDKFVGSSLSIKSTIYEQDDITNEMFHKLRDTWCTPDGADIMDAASFWRHCREISCGFFYRWKYPAPKEWLSVRKDWAKFVRSTISNNRRGIDTEAQVAMAVTNGEYNAPEYAAWVAIRDSFTPETEAIWHSLKFVEYCKKWLQDNAGLLWVDHREFGNKLSEISGIPYYREMGKNATGELIELAKGPVIASIQANSEGRNLQQWSNNFIASCPPSASTLEQLIGRTHRSGQESDEVSVEIVLGCRENWDGLNNALEQAKYIESTTGSPQKIIYADKSLIERDKIELLEKKHWAWKKSA